MNTTSASGARRQPKNTILIETLLLPLVVLESEPSKKISKQVARSVVHQTEGILSSHQEHLLKKAWLDLPIHRSRWVLMKESWPITFHLRKCWPSTMIRKMKFSWKKARRTKLSESVSRNPQLRPNLLWIANWMERWELDLDTLPLRFLTFQALKLVARVPCLRISAKNEETKWYFQMRSSD